MVEAKPNDIHAKLKLKYRLHVSFVEAGNHASLRRQRKVDTGDIINSRT
jgi:hypothetical protein